MGITERKQREKEQRKEAILEHAERIFIKKGLAGTTMNDVADACELSKATLYLYYKSKEELFLTVLHRALHKLADMMEFFCSQGKNPFECYMLIGVAYVEFFRRYPKHFAVLSSRHDHEGLFKEDLREIGMKTFEANNRIWAVGVSAIKVCIEQGVIKKDTNPHEIEIMMWTTSNGVLSLLQEVQDIPPEMMQEMDHNDREFQKLDLMAMLRKVWGMIIMSIVVQPISLEQINLDFARLLALAEKWPDSDGHSDEE